MANGTALITALFPDPGDAERAYALVSRHGYTAEDVRLQMTAETRDRLLAEAVRGGDEAGAIDGLVGALVGERIPEQRVSLYEEGLCAGGILLGVTVRSAQDAEQLEREWSMAGARQVFCPLLGKRAA
jgi:hypothetical protein